MKKPVTAVIIMFLSTISTLKADYDVFPVSGTDAVNPANPDICGDWVVWQDMQTMGIGTDIYGYTLAEPNAVEICVYSGEQEVPKVCGQYVVWQDYRNAKREIRTYDLLSRSEPTFSNLTVNNTFHKRYPAVSDEVIVWQDYRNGDRDIFMYDITTDTERAVFEDGNESWSQSYPSLDGMQVVWMDNRSGAYQIYISDISGDPPYAAHPISPSDNQQYYPVIDGHLIVWEEFDSHDNGTLVTYDLDAGTVIWSHAFPAGTHANADVSDGIIVWHEPRSGASDYDIHGYNTGSGAYFDIATGDQDDRDPAIWGRRIVWQRGGVAIVGAEVPSPTQIQVDAPTAGSQFMAGKQIDIAWQLVGGAPPAFVDVKYSLDGRDPNLIEEDIPFTQYQYHWTDTTGIDSQQCRIFVCNSNNASTAGISELFTIFECSLTADVTGDCFVGFEDFAELAAQWLTCGNPYDETWCFN